MTAKREQMLASQTEDAKRTGKKKPSVVLMGSKPGAAVALEIMLRRGWDVTTVVTSEKTYPFSDESVRLHPWSPGPTVEQVAEAAGVPVTTQDMLSRMLTPDFVISYMFRHRVKLDVINMARRAALNFHAGPLPEYGGWAFYNIAILENADEYGCTCHYMDEGFDTGPLLKVRRFPIDPTRETAVSLEMKAQEEMIRLFIDFCLLAESDTPLPVEQQDSARMRYLSRQQFERLKAIPAEADAETIQRYARAFWYPPYECAYVTVGEARVEVLPALVKQELAAHLHADDTIRLQEAANRYRQEVEP